MRTIAFVPARCGSKSIPLKNIKSFCGKPLIYWVLKALDGVDRVDETHVATDCEEIKAMVKGFGFSKTKIYMREPENAQDHSSTESVILEFLENQHTEDDCTFLLVQATCPLTQSSDFINALEIYRNRKADSLLSCARVKIFLWSREGKPLNYDYNNRPRRQEIQGELMENGAFYITSVGNVRKNRNRLSGNISIYEMPEYTAIDIDDEDDWLVAEMLMNKYILKNGVE
ncbi:MAG: acylneuraminate cytidylyltransferase family protein [Proteobacteria bacterium]|nr:acylneuraminate cytidylyltransferase family protein [Pseudomonadota bacterium]MBU1710264.1 acylneuraminate cytidylyltransferase family protein [Pseudomonadota bacterium]